MTTKSEINSAAKERVESTKDEREKVLKDIQSSRPLDAEKNIERKIHRIQSVIKVGYEQAKKIVEYDKVGLVNLTGEKLASAERIQGKTIDFMPISFLDLARSAANTVARVVYRNIREHGSGFMISDSLFLTNNHVISNEEQARRFLVQFDYELDEFKESIPTTIFALDPDKFFLTAPETKFDFTIVAIGERVRGEKTLADFGYCPLLGGDDKHVKGEHVNIIQHPEGDPKQVVLRKNQIVARVDTLLHYMTDTMPGSSGSPVFNDQWEAIALHHWGAPSQTVGPDGKELRRDVNEGVRISAIRKEAELRSESLTVMQRNLLNSALNSTFRHPSTPERSSKNMTVRLPSKSMKPQLTGLGGTITCKIPLEISIRCDNLEQSIGRRTQSRWINATQSISAEAVQIDDDYSNRPGYDPDFIPNHRIPLPQLNNEQKRLAAEKLVVNGDEDPHELKYQHFSVVMNAQRLMAFFTASNIDGATWIRINRATGEPSEAAEATEKWYEDPRIDWRDQCDQRLYDKQRPKRIFDRGHLVRRQGPAWGNKDTAIKANADTFHFTNCVPQQSTFNQRSRFWKGIEDYIINNATEENVRVSVFTGPVFNDEDPDYRYTQVPKQFWKILIRVENGELLATAFLADQSNLIKKIPGPLEESFDVMSQAVEEFQTTVEDIQKLTGLDFGSLRNHDTFGQDFGESVSSKIKLESFADIKLNSSTKKKNRTD